VLVQEPIIGPLHHLKIHYLDEKSPDFDDIWYATAYLELDDSHMTKYDFFLNSRWRTAAILKISRLPISVKVSVRKYFSQNFGNEIISAFTERIFFLMHFGLRRAAGLSPRIALTHWSKNGVFAPQGRNIAPINVIFGTGDAVRSPCQSRLSGHTCGNAAPKTIKIWNFAQKFAPQGRLVCTIFLRNCQRLYISLAIFQFFNLVA